MQRISALEELAGTAPIDAILEGWKEMERAIRDTVQMCWGETPTLPSDLITSLRFHGTIDAKTEATIHELREIRNRAGHDPGFEPLPDEALDFLAQARRVMESLGPPKGGSS
jgi:hypothetical protein